jgi:large subunit ribosomal protein L24
MGAPQEDAKREFDFPFNVNDLRLVVPMTVTELHDGRPVKVQQDVIVDKITLERYTRGVDPYTGTRTYKNTIPEEHRKDPKTDLPIYHRYIAGTRHVIEWPLEASVDDLGVPEEEATNTPEESRGIGGSVRKGLSVLASPFSRTRARPALESGLFSKSKKPEDDTLAAAEEEANEYRPRQPLYTPKEIERESLPYSDVAEAPEHSAPQDQLIDTADILSRQQSSAKAQEDRAASDELKIRTKPRILKTPQQLVWEYEARQRRKTTFVHHNQRPKLPVDLLTAIGMHMEKNGVKAPPRSGRDTEVD